MDAYDSSYVLKCMTWSLLTVSNRQSSSDRLTAYLVGCSLPCFSLRKDVVVVRLQGGQVVAPTPAQWQIPAVLQGLFPSLLLTDQNQIVDGTEDILYPVTRQRFQAFWFPSCTIQSKNGFACTPKQGLINTVD
ncbi:unnamed protein product [Arctogadus glacialis]